MATWQNRTPEQRARYTASAKAKRHAKALVEGRIPGQIGTPKILTTQELREASRIRNNKRKSKRALKVRTAKRAIKAIAEGRVPGKAGQPPRLTKEERKASDKASFARYREKNREYIRKRDAEIKREMRKTSEGRAILKAAIKKYTSTHKEKISAVFKAWYEKNGEKMKKYRNDHYKANKQKYFANNRKRRALKKGNGGTHTAEDIRSLFFEQKGMCAWCETALDATDYHVDHWKPLSKGGSNDKSNLKLLHPKCNLSKGAKLPPEFNTMIA